VDLTTHKILEKMEFLNDVTKVSFSLDGQTFAIADSKGKITLYDLLNIHNLTSPQYIQNQINTLRKQWSKEIKGLQVVSVPHEKSQYYNSGNAKPAWSKLHSLHWLPKAEQGDGNSMIELGNLYLRDDDISKAKHWFNRALALPKFKEIASERLRTTERIVEYTTAEKSD